MPIVEVDLIEGRTEEQKRKIAEGICRVLMEEGDAKREAVKVKFNDMKPWDYSIGGKLYQDL